jgi:hypothetical protein
LETVLRAIWSGIFTREGREVEYVIRLALTGVNLCPDMVQFVLNREPEVAYRKGDVLVSGGQAAFGK